MTATAGDIRPPLAGESVEVSAMTTPVTAVPIIMAANPREKPAASAPWKMSAAKEMQ